MSLKQFISDFNGAVEFNHKQGNTSFAQKSKWLANGLAKINSISPLADQQSNLDIKSDDSNLLLPRNYNNTVQLALMAVEYGFSQQFIADLRESVTSGDLLTSPIINRLPRYRAYGYSYPTPRVTSISNNGITRKALILHTPSNKDRRETLIYFANYEVSDFFQELVITAQPVASNSVEIVGLNSLTYEFVSTTPSTNQVKIGSTLSFTVSNLANAINKNTKASGVQAKVFGNSLRLFSANEETDLDFNLVLIGNFGTLEAFEPVNNLDSDKTFRAYKWMEGEHCQYIAHAFASKLGDRIINSYEKKSANAFTEALNGLHPPIV